jgi:hypothetical protein
MKVLESVKIRMDSCFLQVGCNICRDLRFLAVKNRSDDSHADWEGSVGSVFCGANDVVLPPFDEFVLVELEAFIDGEDAVFLEEKAFGFAVVSFKLFVSGIEVAEMSVGLISGLMDSLDDAFG